MFLLLICFFMQILEEKKYFEHYVKSFITKTFPKYYDKQLIDSEHSNIQEFDRIFGDLFRIYKYHEKYDLHWALKQANKEFFHILKQVSEEQLQPRLDHVSAALLQSGDLKDIKKYMKDLLKVTKKREKNFKRKSRYFSFLSVLISMIDIVVSVILIVLISMVSHIGNTLFESIFLSTLFVAFIALSKVTLDRFWVIPLIHRL